MDKTLSKSLFTYLQDSNQEMQTIFAKIKLLEELQQQFAALLEPTFAKYCQVANLTSNKLVIIVANGSIATQLRFQANDLIKKMNLAQPRFKIQTIECKVRPPQAMLPDRLREGFKHSPKKLSLEAEKLLAEIMLKLSS